ncbi:winged helix-turn-helix transcriptional regulator [Actinoplanes sp. HUAS TT8]|uniref:winged helix-turn-helix transcriptional regulator n=1 Tax=Actinoplanes sp. HUAS TT8 TaxID=3447453 RepID=UPI003F525145
MTAPDDGVITLLPPFAERDRFTAEGWCPMERALDLIGTRSAMTLLREVYYGGTRFDDLARRAGVTPAVASDRLKRLVEAGLLERRPYREPGQRTRYEYTLTDRGRDVFPVLVALMRLGDELPREKEATIGLSHAGCGEPIVPEVRCAAGHEVPLNETVASIVRP